LTAAQRTFVRVVALFSLLAPPASSVVVLAAMLSTPSYHPLSRSLSVLGEHGAPLSLAVNAGFAALGISVLALGVALDRTLAGTGRWGVRLLVLAGAALVGVALVARDPGHPVPLALHRMLALVAFVSLAVAPILLSRRLGADLGWRAHARPSLGFGLTALCLLVVGAVLIRGGQLRAGAWEIAFAGLSLVWLMLTAARLAVSTWRPRPPSSGGA
jgi:hypothetical membrane protein